MTVTNRQLERVLLVDDDADIRRVGELALARVGGLDVEVCASGAEAIERAPHFGPDLVLLDIMMPGMGGLAVFQALTALPKLEGVSVIFVTAKAQQHEVQRYLATGAIGVIKKPFDPMSLADDVRELWKAYMTGR